MEGKKIGRPTNNPKGKPIHIRLDDESNEILRQYMKENVDVTSRAEAVRVGIKKLKDDIKKSK